MEDLSLDEDSGNEMCLPSKQSENYVDKKGTEATGTNNTPTKAIDCIHTQRDDGGEGSSTCSKNRALNWMSLMMKNIMIPLINIRETAKRDMSDSSEDEDAMEEDVQPGFDRGTDYKRTKPNETDTKETGRNKPDIPKIHDGVVSLFEMFNEKDHSCEAGPSHPVESGSRYAGRRRRGKNHSHRIHSDEQSKQMISRFMDSVNKIMEGFGAYSDNESFMEGINNRFERNPMTEKDKTLTINVNLAFRKAETKLKTSQKVSRQIKEMLENEVFLNNIVASNNILKKYTNFCPILPSGSVSDGFSTPRWFANNDVWEIESDLMYVLGTYPQNSAHYFSNYPDQRAYCQIQCSEHHSNLVHPEVYEVTAKTFTDGLYVDSLQFKRHALQFIRQYHLKKDGSTEGSSGADILFHCSSQFPFFNPQRLQNLKSSFSMTGHLASTVICTVVTYKTFTASIDHVPCLKLDFWPKAFQGWLTRGGEWPTVEERMAIMSRGCHVVPKTSHHILQNGWRYSFSLPEHLLTQLFSHGQRQSYYLFKALFYKYIKHIGQEPRGNNGESDTIFHSYLFKTTMFWICEKYPPQDELWKDENLFLSVEVLLSHFEKSMHDRFLPHFFIPDYNLIQDVPVDLMTEAAAKARRLRDRIIFYIPYNTEELIHYVKDTGVKFGLHIAVELTLQHSFYSTDCCNLSETAPQ